MVNESKYGATLTNDVVEGVDIETGLFYNYFRTYDPKTGRYTQNDPIGLGGGLNRFGYAYQNGLMFTDPFGLDPWYRDWRQNRSYPTWEPNNHESFNRSNNCYSYAMNRSGNLAGHLFGQAGYHPGERSGKRFGDLSCQDIFGAAKRDGATPVESGGSCPAGFHKGRLFVNDSFMEGDYHWYRQNGDGSWSHKPGKHPAQYLGPNPPNTHPGYPTSCGDVCLPN